MAKKDKAAEVKAPEAPAAPANEPVKPVAAAVPAASKPKEKKYWERKPCI